MSEILKRPNAAETDDDLLLLQQEFALSQKKASAEVHKMKKRSKIDEKPTENLNPAPKSDPGNSNSEDLAPKPRNHDGARFQLELDDDTATGILYPVRERPFSTVTELRIHEFRQFSADDGFPEPLDLSDYYKPKSGRSLRATVANVSFFAAEFDRIHGNLAENLDLQAMMTTQDDDVTTQDFESENEKYLKSLEPEKIQEMKMEISEKIDPKLLEFLKNRSKTAKNGEKPEKISKFKASRMKRDEKGAELSPEGAEPIVKKGAEPPVQKQVEEMMNELEVLEEWENRDDQEKYNRLATDAIQLDLTAKFSRNLISRQQKNAVKLFDNCKFRPDGEGPSDPLLEQARSKIDEIKQLYLEEVSTDETTVTHQFGKGLNPILDNCWTLVPVRRVLDAVEKRQGVVTPDDVDIVRLAVQWTYLLYSEKKSAFFAFAQPNEFYIHLAEILMIGAEILADDVISQLTYRILRGYVFENARNGKISIRMEAKIAGLDAFMPFYEQLLKSYEQYSMGDAMFAMVILIGAYLNAPVGDSLEYRFALWSPKRTVIRQMTVSSATCRDLLEAIKQQISERESVIYEQHYVQYCSLLGAYVAAIRDNVITRDRNQLMFEIASFEIGKFMEYQKKDGKKAKEFHLLTDIIQKSIGDKLVF